MAVESLQLESRPPLTVEEFEALAKSEGWDEDGRVELLDGELVWMSPINDPHIGCVNRLNRLFSRRYPEQLVLVSIQNAIRVSQLDEPQPDIALLKFRSDYYGTAKAIPPDVLLLVEISDTTLRTDLGRKARIYASASVQEYWVIDLNNKTVYVHRTPSDGAYTTRLVLSAGDQLSARFAPTMQFAFEELLG
jgi:Uma2 family endonuclease